MNLLSYDKCIILEHLQKSYPQFLFRFDFDFNNRCTYTLNCYDKNGNIIHAIKQTNPLMQQSNQVEKMELCLKNID